MRVTSAEDTVIANSMLIAATDTRKRASTVPTNVGTQRQIHMHTESRQYPSYSLAQDSVASNLATNAMINTVS